MLIYPNHEHKNLDYENVFHYTSTVNRIHLKNSSLTIY